MANIKKNAQGYGYSYTDLAAINDYIEGIGETYYQEVERIEGDDYIITVRLKQETALKPGVVEDVSEETATRIRGCRVVQASLSGKVNPAQEQGSGLTYARRYSLLMAYGLATEDDDAESLTVKGSTKKPYAPNKDKEVTDQQKIFIANLLRQKGVEGKEAIQEYLADKYGILPEAFMSQADAQMIIDDHSARG